MSSPATRQDTFDTLNGPLHAFARFSPAGQPSAAKGPLHGWVIAIKDSFDLAGEVARVGTLKFPTRWATATASAVERLLDAGEHIVGHTQMFELAFGGWGINAAMDIPHKPWDGHAVQVVGGSCSGSAVAVAIRIGADYLGQ